MNINNISLSKISKSQNIEMNKLKKVKSKINKQDKIKSERISDSYDYLLNTTRINPKEIWSDIIKPIYILEHNDYTQQSWRSASGTAFEYFLATYYQQRLPSNYRIRKHGSKSKQQAVKSLGLENKISKEKIDLTIEYKHDDTWKIIGCPHVKTSLRERISDLRSASEILIRNNIFSPILTIDAQSELGGSRDKNPNLGRSLIENQGVFSNMYCYNIDAEPTTKTDAKSQIKIINLPNKQDAFLSDIKSIHIDEVL